MGLGTQVMPPEWEPGDGVPQPMPEPRPPEGGESDPVPQPMPEPRPPERGGDYQRPPNPPDLPEGPENGGDGLSTKQKAAAGAGALFLLYLVVS